MKYKQIQIRRRKVIMKERERERKGGKGRKVVASVNNKSNRINWSGKVINTYISYDKNPSVSKKKSNNKLFIYNRLRSFENLHSELRCKKSIENIDCLEYQGWGTSLSFFLSFSLSLSLIIRKESVMEKSLRAA